MSLLVSLAFLLTDLRANLTCMGELNHDVSCQESKECNAGTWIWDLTYGINHKKLITHWAKRKQQRILCSSIWVRPSVLKTGLNQLVEPVEPGIGGENGSIWTGFMTISWPDWTGRFGKKTGSTGWWIEPEWTGLNWIVLDFCVCFGLLCLMLASIMIVFICCILFTFVILKRWQVL